MHWMASWTIVAALALGGCSQSNGQEDAGCDAGTDAGADSWVDPRPEPICNRGFATMYHAFVDRTEEAGLSETGVDARGFRMMGADLDGDGYVDLVTVDSDRTSRGQQHVYMNRPHPDEPGRRVFLEANGTGIDTNRREGIEGRAVSFHVAGDVDNDGDLDLFAGSYVGELDDLLDRQEILLNDGDGNFTLIEGGSSVATDDPPANAHAVLFDYDRDGNLDLYVGNWYQNYPYIEALQDELYRGRGDGTFERVTEQAGLAQQPGYGTHDNRKPTYGLTHCDLDGDGHQDILHAGYGRQWNDLFLNNGDGTFTNIGESSGFDGDDLTDYTDNEFYRCWCRDQPDCTPDRPPVVDCSARGWSSLDTQPFRLNGNTFGHDCGDFDRDGDLDVFSVEIAHAWAGSSSDRSRLLVNDGGAGTALVFSRPPLEETGIDRPHDTLFWDEGDINAGFVDFDNDGFLDLVLHAGAYSGGGLHIFRQMPSGGFRDITEDVDVAAPRACAMVLADYDLDGDVDIFAGTQPGRVLLLENRAGQVANWTRITLEGKGPPEGANRAAIGARVTVTSGDLVQIDEVRTGAGHFGRQDELPLTFGFNDRCGDLTIEVRWPNPEGTVQVFDGVRANYPVRIVEGEDEVVYLTEQP